MKKYHHFYLQSLFVYRFGKGRKTPVDEVGKNLKPTEHKDNLDGEARTHREHIEQEEQRWRQAQAEQERSEIFIY